MISPALSTDIFDIDDRKLATFICQVRNFQHGLKYQTSYFEVQPLGKLFGSLTKKGEVFYALDIGLPTANNF